MPVAVFRIARRTLDTFSYTLPAAAGSYQLRLFFLEDQPGLLVGGRVFDVYVQGTLVMYHLDVLGAVGFRKPLLVQVPVELATAGTVTIIFGKIIARPRISAIELIPDVPLTPAPAPTTTTTTTTTTAVKTAAPGVTTSQGQVTTAKTSTTSTTKTTTTPTTPTTTLAPLTGTTTFSDWRNEPGGNAGGKDYREAMGMAFEEVRCLLRVSSCEGLKSRSDLQYYYHFGGFLNGWTYMSADAWRYHPVFKTWQKLPSVPGIGTELS
jgi:hypothetical protein